jgi:hypothetical protein
MKSTSIVVFAAIVLSCTVAYAHHSYGAFDRDRSVSIEGNIEEIRYENPHTIVKVKTKDSLIYTAEWQTIAQLRRANALYELKNGDHVVLTGCPYRDEQMHKLALLTEVRRTADGWVWSVPPRTSPPPTR